MNIEVGKWLHLGKGECFQCLIQSVRLMTWWQLSSRSIWSNGPDLNFYILNVMHAFCVVNVLLGILLVGGSEKIEASHLAHLLWDQPPSPLPVFSTPSTPDEPCLRQGAASSPAPFAIILGTLRLMPLRIQRSLILLHRPSTLPRLRLKMAAHFPLLSKLWACRGKCKAHMWL